MQGKEAKYCSHGCSGKHNIDLNGYMYTTSMIGAGFTTMYITPCPPNTLVPEHPLSRPAYYTPSLMNSLLTHYWCMMKLECVTVAPKGGGSIAPTQIKLLHTQLKSLYLCLSVSVSL